MYKIKGNGIIYNETPDYYQKIDKPNFKRQDITLIVVLSIALVLAIYWTI